MSPVRIAALLAACLLVSCLSENGDDSVQAEEQGSNASDSTAERSAEDQPVRDPILVRVAPLTRDSIENKREITATVESLDVVDVVAERSEPILEVLVEEGDVVKKDQVLATLRTKTCQMAMDDAKVRVEESHNAYLQAKRDHERNLNLQKSASGGSRLISEREVEASAQAVVTAETAWEASKVGKERAQFDLDNCWVRAPIDGTVTLRHISTGDFATMGGPAFQITDLSAPKAVFFRPQRELALLHVGQLLTATSEALPGRTIKGTIERISPTVDSRSGTVKVTAALSTEGGAVPIGVLVTLNLVLKRHENALLVPKRALLYEGRSPYCYVVRDWRAVRLDLEPGFESPDFLEVIPGPNGPYDDDEIVIVGADRLAPGDPIEIADRPRPADDEEFAVDLTEEGALLSDAATADSEE